MDMRDFILGYAAGGSGGGGGQTYAVNVGASSTTVDKQTAEAGEMVTISTGGTQMSLTVTLASDTDTQVKASNGYVTSMYFFMPADDVNIYSVPKPR